MLDRLGNEVDFTELFMEEALSAKDKKELPDSMYGLVYTDENGNKIRKFPLNDESHVRQAAIFFDRAKGLSEDQKRTLARNIVRRAKELDMDYSGWESLKPYLDKSVKESYDPDPDFTSGTSDFDECVNDDEYYGEADQTLMNQIQKNENNIPILQLRTYAKKCIHEGQSYNGGDKAYIFECIKNDANNQDKRCHEYFFNLIKEIDKCIGDQDLRKMENRPQKWFRYEKLINKFFSSIGVKYGKDRVVTGVNLHAHRLTFLEKEFVKFRYDPTTDILIHRTRRNNLLFLKPSHASGDGVAIYPKPRIYFTLEPRSRYTVKGAYGDYAYTPNINKPIDVFYDTESPSHASINVNSDKYGKDVFINTYKPLAVKQITSDNTSDQINQQQTESQNMSSPPPIKESFEEMFGPVIQEAFDAITGEEIPIEKAYTMDEMKEITFSDKELKNSKKEIKEYLKLAKEIVKRISKQVEKDAKPPTGNQNCLLCTWCAEAGFRGMNALPRPVYSPCDPIFEVIGENIVREPERIPLRGFDNLMEHLMDAQKPFARFYAHVNWIESKGGHEFLILKISANECYVVDAQQGDVEPLTDVHKYFAEINWDNSYICRLDNKNFNNRLFEIMNDPKKTLPWDPKRDIPYMLREGLITKEEAERELKDAETNTFYKELKKALGQTPIQESAWGDIRNGVNPWSMKRVFHISPEGHLDGQIFKPRVPEYLDEYDPSKTEFEDVETPRVCFSPSIEGCLNAILVNIGRWKTANKLRDWYVYIPEKPLKEYKYRTNKQLVDEKKVYDANLTKEIWIEEPVRLKQYGIIRIDSVTDVNRKKAVPTTLGESKKRNVYDFKWHWLVKPKVLKDVPYDYSPKEVCKDMVSDLSRFKYGLGYNGSIHHGSSKDFDEKYRLESPEEFEKNGGGICYDFVEFEQDYLEAYGYTCRKFFISTDTEDMDTHTFILVDDGNGKFIYPEAAFKLLEGTYTVKFLDEAVDMIMRKVWDINDNKSKYDKIKYYVWEYEGHPPYASDMKTCHEYFTKGEPIAEGMIKNPYKRKD